MINIKLFFSIVVIHYSHFNKIPISISGIPVYNVNVDHKKKLEFFIMPFFTKPTFPRNNAVRPLFPNTYSKVHCLIPRFVHLFTHPKFTEGLTMPGTVLAL